jgi:hypothetical protein
MMMKLKRNNAQKNRTNGDVTLAAHENRKSQERSLLRKVFTNQTGNSCSHDGVTSLVMFRFH